MEILRLLGWFKVGHPCVLVWPSYHISYVICHISNVNIYIYVYIYIRIYHISYQLHAVHISWCHSCLVNQLCTESFSFELWCFVMQMVSASSPTVTFNGCKSRGRIRSSSLENLATLSLSLVLRVLNVPKHWSEHVDLDVDLDLWTREIPTLAVKPRLNPYTNQTWCFGSYRIPAHGLFFGFKWSKAMQWYHFGALRRTIRLAIDLDTPGR